MLGHHIDTTGSTTTSLARFLADLRKALPEWFPLQVFLRFSDDHPLDPLPRRLGKASLRLARLFDGRKLLIDRPRLHRTFELFLRDSFPAVTLPTELGPSAVNRLHITTCLKIMAQELRFNILEYPSSFLRNKDVLSLAALKQSNISPHLRYACRHWADRISQLKMLDTELSEMVSGFFLTHFLPWLEVLSILALSPVDVLKNLVAIHVCNYM